MKSVLASSCREINLAILYITMSHFYVCAFVDDIKVKFSDDKWEADGIFQGTDVHYQVGISYLVYIFLLLGCLTCVPDSFDLVYWNTRHRC